MNLAIILSAGENPPTSDWEKIKYPKSLVVIKGKPLLAHLVSNLKKVGITRFVTVVGENGRGWESPEIYDKFKKFSPIAINDNNTNSGIARSFQIGWEYLHPKSTDRVFVLDGDLLFHPKILLTMLNSSLNSILVQRSDSLSSKDGIVEVNQSLNLIIRCGKGVIPNTFPWYKYSGISLFNFEISSELSNLASKNPNNDLLSLISIVSEKWPITIVHTTDILNQSVDEIFEIEKDLRGGSLANLNVKRIVRKECYGRGAKKLKNEYEWLLEVIGNNSKHFPKVLDYGNESNYAWYEMPHFNYPSLRKELLLGRIDTNDVIKQLEIILEYLWHNIYSKIIPTDPDQRHERTRKVHFSRIENRINDVWRHAQGFREIIQADKIVINKIQYPNLPQLVSSVQNAGIARSRLDSINISHIHGDLHFQNILLNPSSKPDFILTDPRGDLQGNDFFYDLGKLWHSFHGKYDFIHSGLYNFEYKITEGRIIASYSFRNNEALDTYRELEERIPELVGSFEWVNEIPNWKERVLFSEACHFSSVTPFHLNKKDMNLKAILLYLTGVKLMTEYCKKFNIKIRKYSPYIINIDEPFTAYDEISFKDLD